MAILQQFMSYHVFTVFLQIHFPSGTNIEVTNHRFNGLDTLDLHVNPSSADYNFSEGLCGTVGSGKLFSPHKVDLTNNVKEFTKSWRYVYKKEEGVDRQTDRHTHTQTERMTK